MMSNWNLIKWDMFTNGFIAAVCFNVMFEIAHNPEKYVWPNTMIVVLFLVLLVLLYDTIRKKNPTTLGDEK